MMTKLFAIALPSLLIGGLMFGPALGHADDGGIAGVKDLVDGQLDSALKSLPKDLPADVRAKLEQRLAKVRATVDKRLGNMKITDLDQLGEELGKMGDDMDKWGKRFGHNFSMHMNDDDDDDNAVTSVPDIDDQDDLDDAVRDLGDLSLKPPQRDAIAKLRLDSDKQVTAAKRELDKASDTLHKQLDNPATSDADIAKSIDAVTQQEAAIRKARILAWHGARRVLDDAQRKKVQDAAKGKTK
jgi:hypothetical protein